MITRLNKASWMIKKKTYANMNRKTNSDRRAGIYKYQGIALVFG